MRAMLEAVMHSSRGLNAASTSGSVALGMWMRGVCARAHGRERASRLKNLMQGLVDSVLRVMNPVLALATLSTLCWVCARPLECVWT